MKKTIINVLIISLAAAFALGLYGCKNNPEKELHGSWYTEQSGVGMTVSFGEDGTMTVVCKITDKKAADNAGVNPNIVDSKNISCFYTVSARPDLSELSAKEQELLQEKGAITSYLTREDMENSLPGEVIYFTLEGDTLTTTQRSGVYDPQTDIPEYSDTVFTRN